MMHKDFLAQYAQTLNFTLGVPKAFKLSGDGRRIFFLRTPTGTSRYQELWLAMFDEGGMLQERCLVSAAQLEKLVTGTNADPEAERLRKERMREAASGITAYSVDRVGDRVAFGMGGDVFVYAVDTEELHFMGIDGATDVGISPDGKKVAYVQQSALYVAAVKADGIAAGKRISPAATKTLSWGLPDFIAAEEMDRHQGYWWWPDSSGLMYMGVDVASVQKWYISSPTDPQVAPVEIRYPQAGTDNALLQARLWRPGAVDVAIAWDNDAYPYVAGLRWHDNKPYLAVQTRDQRALVLLAINTVTGQAEEVYRKTDPHWVELAGDLPALSAPGQVMDLQDELVRQLVVAGKVVSVPGHYVRRYCGTLASGAMVYVASDDPTEAHVWLTDLQGRHTRLTEKPGVYDAVVCGDAVVVQGYTLEAQPGYTAVIDMRRDDMKHQMLENVSARMVLLPQPKFRRTEDGIDYAVLYPTDFDGKQKLPVLFDPYGGPLFQSCLKSARSFSVSQWFAEQGFAVLVADGRGTPGHNRAWEKAIMHDLTGPVLADQVAVLEAAIAAGEPLGTSRVAIRGWSFGGYLAALAVLQRPDVFHVGVAGAPVTDWRLYDTHYTERYLGDPRQNDKAYEACSLLRMAPQLTRPLLLIHGLSDDNVVSAHTLQLSQALFAAGKPHSVLPLTGITHMMASAEATEAMLGAQLAFIRQSLG